MKCKKLNKNWNAEPNAPDPAIKRTDEGIELTFLLNPFKYQHIAENDKGTLEFFDVFAYRLGATNDEGYYRGEFRFKNEQLPWGEFYELIDSQWKNDFPDDKIILNDSINKNKLRHFILFLKDETFECLALEYKFSFGDMVPVSDKLETKYPKGYLNHYLAMFTSQFNQPTIDNYIMFTDLYIQMEGNDEFLDLKKELKNIKMNNDHFLYVKFVNYFEIENFGMEQLNDMIKVIETYKMENMRNQRK